MVLKAGGEAQDRLLVPIPPSRLQVAVDQVEEAAQGRMDPAEVALLPYPRPGLVGMGERQGALVVEAGAGVPEGRVHVGEACTREHPEGREQGGAHLLEGGDNFLGGGDGDGDGSGHTGRDTEMCGG